MLNVFENFSFLCNWLQKASTTVMVDSITYVIGIDGSLPNNIISK